MKRKGSRIAEKIVKTSNTENYYKNYAKRKKEQEENKKRY